MLKYILSIYVIIYIMLSGSATSYSSTAINVDLNIDTIMGMDGSLLKPQKNGLAFLRFYNPSSTELTIPLIYTYGKGVKINHKTTFLSKDIKYYAGYEIAQVKYLFFDSDGKVSLEGDILTVPDTIILGPHKSIVLSVPIMAPIKPGNYTFKLIFSNQNLQRAIDSYNIVDFNIRRNLFYKEIRINGILIK